MVDGFSFRPARPRDAETILAVGVARDAADIGYPDWSLDDVREELGELDLERDSLVVIDEAGQAAAFGWIHGEDARVAVHPRAVGLGIGTSLRAEIERRAAAQGATAVRQQVVGSDDAARELLAAAGYEAEQRHWRMALVLEAPRPEPAWPDGLDEVRAFELGADDRAAHALVEDAFADIPGNVARTFDDWHARALAGAQFAPELSTVATAGGEPIGLALVERWEAGDGYVSYLAVARPWRGRGLGRALLAGAIAKLAAAGARRAVLGVNARNESATRLYRAAGMEVEFRADIFVKRL